MEPTVSDTSDSSAERSVQVRNTFNKYLQSKELLAEFGTIDSLRGKSDKVLQAIRSALGELSKDLSVDQAIVDLELVEVDSPEAKKAIYNYLIDQGLKGRFLLHAFNGVFEESINQYGLDPDIRIFDQEELDAVQNISDTRSNATLLGWQKSSRGKVYLLGITEETMDSPIYRYALSSPEWFAQFCQGGSRFVKDDRFDNEAFMRRDYEASKRNIEIYLSDHSPSINEADRATIWAMFEQYWSIFASLEPAPKLAVINALAIKNDLPDIPYERIVALGHDKYPDGREIPIDELARGSLELMFRQQDLGIGHAIDPKDIAVVSLPSFAGSS